MEEYEEKTLDLGQMLAALKRRRRAAVLAIAIGVLATLLLAFLLPARYRSTGTILIEQQEVPQELVRSTVTSYADQRVQVISQRVMTTQNLLEIIRRNNLYPSLRVRASREELIEKMRDDIAFKMISADVIDPRSGLPREATIAFSVSYTSPMPQQAVKVANELTTLYLNENLTERTRLAQDATVFLVAEGDRLSKLIAELEGKLAEFKSKHVEALPELQGLNLQLRDRTEQELRQAEARMMSLDQQRVYLEAQLAQLKPNGVLTTDGGERIMSPTDRLKMLKSQLASARALYSPEHPDIERLQREIKGLEADTGASAAGTNDLRRELETVRGELSAARERYSPEHPDVQRLEQRLAALQQSLAGRADASAAGAEASASASAGESSLTDASGSSAPIGGAQRYSGPGTVQPGMDAPDNPAYIQIQAQLSATQNDRAALEAQMRTLRGEIGSYERKITLAPQIEREYRQLTRDYESAQLKYQEVRSKQMEAQLAQNLETDRKGERFTLIEPPLPPEEPVSPNRPLLLVLGMLLTLGAGAGIVVLLEALDGTVRGRQDMEDAFTVPPMALVPRIITANDTRVRRRNLRLAFGASAAACVGMVMAAHFLFRPLDVLWFVLMRRLGL